MQVSAGRHGFFPWTDWYVPDDHMLSWWDTQAQWCSATGCLPGGHQYLFGGRHFRLGKFPTGELPFLNKAKSNNNGYPTRPKQDIAPFYPCAGCPSSGAPYGSA